MQGNKACAELGPPVKVPSAPPSHRTPSHLPSPQFCVTLREFFVNVLPSSLYRGIALLIARLTLRSQTIDQHRPALVGWLTHADTTFSQTLPSV